MSHLFIYFDFCRKREVNLKVLKVPEIEQKVRHSFCYKYFDDLLMFNVDFFLNYEI